MTLISACMMVKNEERNLDRCLTSLRQVVDEIVVIDTGSTDRTVEIAKEHGATVYHSPWQNDFSFHRNESLEKATGEWCFVIDADEELILTNGGGPGIRAHLEGIPQDCCAARMGLEDIQDGRVVMRFQTDRFFRKGRCTYRGRKHNFACFEGAITQLVSAQIRHYGYDKANSNGKRERDLELLLQMRADDPDNHQVLFWLSQTYGHYFNDGPKALAYCEEYIQRAKNDDKFQASAFVTAAEVARALGDVEKSERYLKEGIERYPDDIDLAFVRVRNAAVDQKSINMRKDCETYLEAHDRLAGQPHTDDGRFRFYFNEDSLCFVLHKIAIDALYRGFDYTEKFYSRLDSVSPVAREDLEKCMTIDLDRVGVVRKTNSKGD